MSNRKLIIGLAAGAALGAAAATGLHAAADTPPKGYLIGQIEVKDADLFAREYAPRVTPVLAAAGGRYLARGGRVVQLEGRTPANRIVLLEFPSVAAAKQFYDSPGYQALSDIRHRAATTDSFIVEGVAPAP